MIADRPGALDDWLAGPAGCHLAACEWDPEQRGPVVEAGEGGVRCRRARTIQSRSRSVGAVTGSGSSSARPDRSASIGVSRGRGARRACSRNAGTFRRAPTRDSNRSAGSVSARFAERRRWRPSLPGRVCRRWSRCRAWPLHPRAGAPVRRYREIRAATVRVEAPLSRWAGPAPRPDCTPATESPEPKAEMFCSGF